MIHFLANRSNRINKVANRAGKEFSGIRWSTFLMAMVLISFCFSTADAQRFRRRAAKDVSAQQVRSAIKDAVRGLKKRQQNNGSWNKYKFTGDVTSLVTLAILNAEGNPDDPQIKMAIDYLVNNLANRLDMTYTVSLRIMVLAAADPKGEKYLDRVESDVFWLTEMQEKKGPGKGGWNYRGNGSPDSSNSQFALLALHEANLMGAEIEPRVWELAKEYWESAYNPRSGGFSYQPGGRSPNGSMTAAGISSTIIIDENLADVEALFAGDRAACCGANDKDDPVERAINWIGKSFSVLGNPGGRGRGDTGTQLYWLYGLERAGRLSGQRFFGPHDWYRAGSARLLSQQRGAIWRGTNHGEDNSDIATSLALLFLAKGKRPVAIGKYKYEKGDNWNIHPKGVHYLSRNLEEIWNKKLNWQTVDGANATVDDLLETPVLFISGKQALDLSDKQKQTLKKYVENGGFIFAEACQGDGCGQAPFDASFRALMRELFPESELEPLPKDHQIWTAHYPLIGNPEVEERPVLGLQACCRTSVIYVPTNLSCYWSLRRPVVQKYIEKNRQVARIQRISQRIDFCSQLGANVVTYATGRELREKGETPKLDGKMVSVLANRALDLPKLSHDGGDDEAPSAWRNVLKEAGRYGLQIEQKKKMVPIDIDRMANFPFMFMHGRKSFELTPDQREDLRTWFDNGGFLFADSICSTPEFTESFKREMELIFETPLEKIPPNHEIWSNKFGTSIMRVTRRVKDATIQGGFREITEPPQLLGHTIDNRLVVVFSEHDLSCAMENKTVSQCSGYTSEDAASIGVNVILYRLRGN